MTAIPSAAHAREAAGIRPDSPGVSTGESVNRGFSTDLVTALGLHRAWDRATDVMSSAVPPAAS